LPSGGAVRLPGCTPCSTAFLAWFILPAPQLAGVAYLTCPTKQVLKLLPRVWQQALQLLLQLSGSTGSIR